MITVKDAEKIFKNPPLEVTPSALKRIIIPLFGFVGGEELMRPKWSNEGTREEMTVGIKYTNPKDGCNQVLKQKDGCLICYDKEGRKEKIEDYLKSHPFSQKTAKGVEKFIDYLKNDVLSDSGKADLWDSDIGYFSELSNAPKIEDIKSGVVGCYAQKKETNYAFFVKAGTEFMGPASTPQIAGKDGAYIIKDDENIRMIQKAEFLKAYEIIKTNTNNTNNRQNPR